MTHSRREFLHQTLAAGAAASLLGRTQPAFAHNAQSRPPLSILILGGTSFLGPHQVAYALARGHSISTFTRGNTKPTIHQELFEDVEQLVGDRDGDLDALRGRTWDAVIDNSGRRVEWTREAAELLRDQVDLYVYTSSTGVYYPYLGTDIDEETELVLAVPEGLGENEGAEYGYGVMKAQSEIEARRVFGADRTIVVRPTYIMGPADSTNRFTYWPVRLSRGGEVLVPGRTDDPVQYIDVRDLTSWMIRLIENRTAGTFNAVGPESDMGMHPFVYGAHAAFNSPVNLVMVQDYEFLNEHRVGFAIPWIMPVENNAGSARVNNRAAIESGLTFTPLAESVRDIHDWWYSNAVTEERRTALESGPRSLMARESTILAAWQARG